MIHHLQPGVIVAIAVAFISCLVLLDCLCTSKGDHEVLPALVEANMSLEGGNFASGSQATKDS